MPGLGDSGLRFPGSEDYEREYGPSNNSSQQNTEELAITTEGGPEHQTTPLLPNSNNSDLISNRTSLVPRFEIFNNIPNTGLYSTGDERMNVLLSDAAQSVLREGYLPKDIKQAVDAILGKKRKGIKTDDIKSKLQEMNIRPRFPDRDTRITELATTDRESLQYKVFEMEAKVVCKGCNSERVNREILNCYHALCKTCAALLNKCPVCERTIAGPIIKLSLQTT